MPLNIDWQQILLHIFNFTILFFALYFLLYKPVKKFMDDRQAYYDDLDKLREENLRDSEELLEKYNEKLSHAEQEAQKIIEDGKAAAAAQAESIIADANMQADKILETSRARAKGERDELLESAKKEIASTASMMAEKIVNESAYDSFIKIAESDGANND